MEEIYTKIQFCPRCATRFPQGDKEKITCSSCNFIFYKSPVPTNGVILLNDNNEILLVERKYEPQNGYWDVPGGFLEAHESIEESVIREVKEELDITLSDFQYFCAPAGTYFYQDDYVPTIGAIFIAKLPSGQTLQAMDDAKSFKFFKLDELPFGKIAFEPIEWALKKYVKENS